MANKIKQLVDGNENISNPHKLSQATGITYRIVLRLYKSPYISKDTKIGTLHDIASALGVTVDDLYDPVEAGSQAA